MYDLNNNVLRKIGLQINKYPTCFLKRRLQLIKEYKINKILDIGANRGQYAVKLRKMGFKGDIVSFEPLSSAFRKLSETAKPDKHWNINNFALGNEDTIGFINIAANSYSSSLLDMLEAHKNASPGSVYIDKEEIQIKRLDSIFYQYYNEKDKIMLKIDTQGFEKNVIDGAENSIVNIVLMQLETSIIPLYNNELLLAEMLKYLESRNFKLIALENGFENPVNHHLLQVDCILINNDYDLKV